MAGGAASKKKLELAERRLAVLALRVQGATFREIESHLINESGIELPKSYDYSQARKDAMYILRQMNKQAESYAAEIRRLNLVRLDELLFAFWPLALEGDYAACDRVLAIIREQDKIEGLAAPEKIALVDGDGNALPPTVTDEVRGDVTALLLAKMGITVIDVEPEPKDDTECAPSSTEQT